MEQNYILSEVFDSDEVQNYTKTDLMPKAKVPQMWNINVPGNDNLVVRMVSYLSKGDAIKQVKMGDKFVQVFLMSLSKSGNIAELRNGLGSDPLGTLNTIFDTVYEQVKKLKMDAVLFRFPAKKLKGQEKTLQRIIKRLAMQRTGNKFVVLEDLYKFTGKYAYVLIYRKNKAIEDISGLPGIDPELYTKVESKVGDVYIDDATGQQVTKLEAVAGSIAKVENSRNERAVISKSKVSRRVLMTTLYSITKPEDLQKYSDEAKEAFVKLQDNPPVYSSSDARPSRIQSFVDDNSKWVFDEISDTLTKPYVEQEESEYRGDVAHIRTAVSIALGIDKNNLESEEIDEKIKPYMIKLSEILKSDKEIVDKFKEISEYTIKYLPADTSYEHKLLAVNDVVSSVARVYNDTVGKAYKAVEESQNFTSEEIDAIRNYTGTNYEDINGFLLGNEQATKKTIQVSIPNLDTAFSKGVKLDKSTVLYRSQRHEYKDLDKSIQNKILYFPNFVSTSLVPMFFNNSFSNTIVKDAPSANNDWESTARLTMGDKVVDAEQDKPSDSIARLGIMISGAHKVKVVIPGDMSHFSDEAEVILPRGSALKIKSVHGSGSLAKKFLVDTSYIAPEQIDESVEMYDGDKFLNEGVLEKYSFSNFVNKQEVIKESATFEQSEAMDILADIMSFDGIPEKFIQ